MKNSIKVKVSDQNLTVDSLTVAGLINIAEILFNIMDKEDLRFSSVLAVLDRVYPENDPFWLSIRNKKMNSKSSLKELKDQNEIATGLNEMIFEAIYTYKYLKESLSVIFKEDSLFWTKYYDWKLLKLSE